MMDPPKLHGQLPCCPSITQWMMSLWVSSALSLSLSISIQFKGFIGMGNIAKASEVDNIQSEKNNKHEQ